MSHMRQVPVFGCKLEASIQSGNTSVLINFDPSKFGASLSTCIILMNKVAHQNFALLLNLKKFKQLQCQTECLTPPAPRDHHPLHWGEGAALRLPRVPVVLRAARPAAGALGRAPQGAAAPLAGVRRGLHTPIQSGELCCKVFPRLRDRSSHD